MSTFLQSRRGWFVRVASISAMLALAGCNESGSDFNPNAAPRARAPGVPVALISLDGAPESVTSRLSVLLVKQATRRDILIVGVDGKPRYRVRGYVTLQASNDDRSNLVWAFDLFDAQRKRASRISGLEVVSTRGEDWSALTDADLERVASMALDDIATFLAPATGSLVSQASLARAASLAASGL
jgi:hypothetical protein